jgi:uncharacterized protein YebE (UPF0316 family)
MMKGKKAVVVLINFIETAGGVTAGILVISSAVKSGVNFFVILFYALGSALGLFLAITITKILSKNLFSVSIITRRTGTAIEDLLREKGFGVTCHEGSGREGNVKVLNIVCRESDLAALIGIASDIDKGAMITKHLIEGLSGGFLLNIRNRLFWG